MAAPLCDACASCLIAIARRSTDTGSSMWHHADTRSFLDAVDMGCAFCSQTFDALGSMEKRALADVAHDSDRKCWEEDVPFTQAFHHGSCRFDTLTVIFPIAREEFVQLEYYVSSCSDDSLATSWSLVPTSPVLSRARNIETANSQSTSSNATFQQIRKWLHICM